jgi:2-C-methyl-D-erythritol 4-phosphate cytidylyltransferase
VLNTPKRASLWEVQTPQVIQKNLLLAAVERVEHDHVEVTDELSMVELLNKPAKLVMGSYSNLKITTPEDLIIASVHLSS